MLEIEYFNPVVEDWTEECQKEEERQKNICYYHLYVITPRMKGVFSIAEMINSSYQKNIKTILCVLNEDIGYQQHTKISFDNAEIKSLNAVKNMIKRNGAIICESLEEVAEYLNNNLK